MSYSNDVVGREPQVTHSQNGYGPKKVSRLRAHRTVVIEKALYVMKLSKHPEGITAEYLKRKMKVPDHAFFRLFDSIDDFQDELISAGWKDLLRCLRHVAARTTGREGLQAIIAEYRKFVNENKGVYYLAVCQGRDSAIGRKNQSQLNRLLHIILATCELSGIDYDTAARNLADVLQGLAVVEITGGCLGQEPAVTHLLNNYIYRLFAEQTAEKPILGHVNGKP